MNPYRILFGIYVIAWGFALILSRVVARPKGPDAPKLAAAADGRGN